MSGRAEHEDLHVEEFVCQAIPGPGMPQAESRRGGENEGIRIVEEFVIDMATEGKDQGKPPDLAGEREQPVPQAAVSPPYIVAPLVAVGVGVAAGGAVGYLVGGPVGIALGGGLAGLLAASFAGLLRRKHRVGRG